jgi:prepilin-type N-terminal cleavage/methylation domain-containing protein
MNKRGFTLVELMAVLILLAVLIGVSVSGIINARDKANKSLEHDRDELLKAAAKKYASNDHVNDMDFKNGKNACISVKTLIEENYLKDPILPNASDAKNEETRNLYVLAKFDNNSLQYTFEVKKEAECTNNRK